MVVAMPKYLIKLRRGWFAIMEIPKSLRSHFGKVRFKQSLGTESLTEAETLVLPIVIGWRLELEEARTGKPSALAERFKRDGLIWQRELREAKGEAREELDGRVVDLMAEAYHDGDSQLADKIDIIVRKGSVPLGLHLEEWLKSLTDTAKTIDMKRSVILAFSEEFDFTHKVNKRAVKTWAHKLRHDADKPQALKTIAKKLSFLNGYWTYLQSAGIVTTEDEPFRNVIERAGRKLTKADGQKGWKPFTPAEVVLLLDQSKAINDPQLTAAIWIAAWTGCRIEEICSLKTDNVLDDRIIIDDAKTAAGNRIVPIHSQLKDAVKELKRTSHDGYLISGLTFNKYGDRSNALGKRFGKIVRNICIELGRVFHSIRKTVVTQLENAGIQEGLISAIIGHEEGRGFTLSVYSGGPSFENARGAIEKLSYPGHPIVECINEEPKRATNGKRRIIHT